jgi:hypothetical protein
VPHIRGTNHVYDVLGEVLDVIADALEVAAYRRQREDPGHRGGIDRDMRDELGEQARVELVDLGVRGDHLRRAIGALVDEAVERGLEVVLHQRGELREIDPRLERGQAVELERALRDPARVVADPLEIGDEAGRTG